jgi:hypothetical protein
MPVLVTRILVFVILAMVWYFGLVWVAVPLSLWYVYHFRGYEFLVLGALLDGYFMTTLALPQYTLIFATLFIAVKMLKPRLRRSNL